MNIRKPIDYTAFYQELDALMAAELPQMKLYREIGKLVCARTEKGAAVAAARRSHIHIAGPTNLCSARAANDAAEKWVKPSNQASR